MVTDLEQRQIPWRALIASALLLVGAVLLDHWAWTTLRYDKVYEKDWGRLFRVMGFLPTWIAGSVALLLYDRERPRHAVLLTLSPAIAGLVGEILKLLIRRERPGLHDGAYVFRDFTDHPLSARALGLPSSHAIVAFGGAAIASYLFPRTWPVWWFLAAGTALTRVLAGQHFLSDVVFAAVIAWFVVRFIWRRFGRREATVVLFCVTTVAVSGPAEAQAADAACAVVAQRLGTSEPTENVLYLAWPCPAEVAAKWSNLPAEPESLRRFAEFSGMQRDRRVLAAVNGVAEDTLQPPPHRLAAMAALVTFYSPWLLANALPDSNRPGRARVVYGGYGHCNAREGPETLPASTPEDVRSTLTALSADPDPLVRDAAVKLLKWIDLSRPYGCNDKIPPA